MKKPVVDYREFRLSRLKEPRFSHIKLLGGWLVYFALYFLTENLIPFERCHVIHCALDDQIPFNEYFAIFYCFWYVLLVGSLLYFFLYDIPNFKRLQTYIMITQAAAMLIYIVYPSVQLLRPETMPRGNFLATSWGSSTLSTRPPASARLCTSPIPWGSWRCGAEIKRPRLAGKHS